MRSRFNPLFSAITLGGQPASSRENQKYNMAGALSSAEEEIEEEGLSSAEKAKDIILKRLYSVNHDHAGKISIQSRKEAFRYGSSPGGCKGGSIIGTL